MSTEFTQPIPATEATPAKGGGGFSSATTNAQHQVQENPRWINMTQRTLENLTHRYISARERADRAAAWPWFGLAFSCISAVATNSTTLTFDATTKIDVQGGYLALAIIGTMKTVQIIGNGVLAWLYDRDATANTEAAKSRVIKRLKINCPADWVPTNVRAYVQVAVEEIRKESAEQGITPVAPQVADMTATPTA